MYLLTEAHSRLFLENGVYEHQKSCFITKNMYQHQIQIFILFSNIKDAEMLIMFMLYDLSQDVLLLKINSSFLYEISVPHLPASWLKITHTFSVMLFEICSYTIADTKNIMIVIYLF